MKTNGVAKKVLALIVLTMGAAQAAEPAAIEILSATVRGQKIDGATVILQRNGERSSSTVTDSSGLAAVREAAADDPAALLIVRHPGYSDLIAKCPCAGMTYALSPNMKTLDGMRIVLNWGDTPRDLDGHLAFPGNHIFFREPNGTDANLDVDHTDGYGPETITITRKHAGERYVYAVQDYSNKFAPNSSELSASHAKVFVYIGQTLIKAYYVPPHHVGNVWRVFAVSGDGEIQDIDTISSLSVSDITHLSAQTIFGAHLDGPQPDDRSASAVGEAVGSKPAVGESPAAATAQASRPAAGLARGESGGSAQSGTSTDAPASSMGGAIPAAARALDVEGEAAYRRGYYLMAIRLFRSAIDQYPAYGQAYSNLGLAFQKSGEVAEALWANRMAIAIAAGSRAAQIRASTHFNNGRIYEDAHQWDDAMREFRAAQYEKASDVYSGAIERMRLAGAQ
jgi:hypothetical protein